MSQKRKHGEAMGGDRHSSAPTKKRPFNPRKGAGKENGKFKRRRPEQDGPSVSDLKSRIRNLRRLLDHVESDPKNRMPANVRIERERELEACQHELEEKKVAAQEAERRNHMIGKYHHVRFFDRQKATRILKKARRQLAEAEGDGSGDNEDKITRLRQEIHQAEVAVNYAIYYPLMKPYSSLYPRTKREPNNPEEDTDMQDANNQNSKSSEHKGDPEMWAAVERAMAEGTLDHLRNSDDADRRQKAKGKIQETEQRKAKKTKDSLQKKRVQSQPKPAKSAEEHEEDDSDGGFFE
ncbi:hypothetical protein M011DRAFT_528174 [Sporormia fimetaria CBS 119925]|uniref:rRNA-processing protein EFG1 n=1 Tax=Sporormia fimetaria CBS 119925 TaxID=1340428 RepID=A0A6A6V554_9PLEO|nr:hypothetical protein M011DRAFT_528174 [Sporormia fimetaria CBS 119925]